MNRLDEIVDNKLLIIKKLPLISDPAVDVLGIEHEVEEDRSLFRLHRGDKLLNHRSIHVLHAKHSKIAHY